MSASIFDTSKRILQEDEIGHAACVLIGIDRESIHARHWVFDTLEKHPDALPLTTAGKLAECMLEHRLSTLRKNSAAA